MKKVNPYFPEGEKGFLASNKQKIGTISDTVKVGYS